MTNSTAPNGAFASASPPPATAAEAWLASAHPAPATVRREWDSPAMVALIPLGRRFEAVRLTEDLVHRVAGFSDWSAVNGWIGFNLSCGPVIHDPACHRYYALVPSGTAKGWRAPQAACLGEGTYLGVPRPDLRELDEHTRASYWAVPVTRPDWLCKAHDVLALVEAHRLLADDSEDLS